MPYFDAKTWIDVRQSLEADGWSVLATGDWSWVYASPWDWTVVRITPFDPAFRLFLEIAEQLTANPHIVRLERFVKYSGGGYAVEMERLEPVESPESSDFIRDLMTKRSNVQLMELYHSLCRVVAESSMPLLVGIDGNPANVMRRAGSEELVLTDGLWIHGQRLLELVTDDADSATALYSASELRCWAPPAMYGRRDNRPHS